MEISRTPSTDTITADKAYEIILGGDIQRTGKYTISGLEGKQKIIYAEKDGYAVKGLPLQIRDGNDVVNADIVLGKGVVFVKGKIFADSTVAAASKGSWKTI